MLTSASEKLCSGYQRSLSFVKWLCTKASLSPIVETFLKEKKLLKTTENVLPSRPWEVGNYITSICNFKINLLRTIIKVVVLWENCYSWLSDPEPFLSMSRTLQNEFNIGDRSCCSKMIVSCVHFAQMNAVMLNARQRIFYSFRRMGGNGSLH